MMCLCQSLRKKSQPHFHDDHAAPRVLAGDFWALSWLFCSLDEKIGCARGVVMKNKLFNQLKTMFALVLAVSLLLPESAGQAMPQSPAPQAQTTSAGFPTDRIIIKYEDGSSAQSDPSASALMDALSDAAGVPLDYARAMSGDAHVLRLEGRLPIDQVEAISANLSAVPGVAYAEPDRIKFPTLTPDDTQYGSQWHYHGTYGINAPAAWDITTGSDSTVVAVIDTGVDTTHPEFSGRIVPGYDFIDEDRDWDGITYFTANDGDGRDPHPQDPGDWITGEENMGADATGGFFYGCGYGDEYGNPIDLDMPSSWHGTHVAGTIAANSNNGSGVAGVNWNAQILPVRVLGKCGGYTSDIVDGMRWAAGLTVAGVDANLNPAKVLNLSLGGYGACSTTEQNAINEIVNTKGAVVVVAAGNEASDASSFSPGNCTNVITVAATAADGKRADYSNYGSLVEISAPGGGNGQGDVLSTSNTGTQGPVSAGYEAIAGTSMATPHVSGVVSLMFALDPTLTPAAVLQLLQNNVTAFPSGTGQCTTDNCGSGILNAGKVIKALDDSLEADLQITGVTLSRTYPELGDPFDINVTVKNMGNRGTSSPVYVQVYVDTPPVLDANSCPVNGFGSFASNTISGASPLGAGEEDTITLTINNAETPDLNQWPEFSPDPGPDFLPPPDWGTGTHNLYVYVDGNCVVDESDESNNSYATNPLMLNPFVEGAIVNPESGENIGTNYNPVFKWNRVLNAYKYRVYIGSNGIALLDQKYYASSVCPSDSNVCSIELGPSIRLKGGRTYVWRVQPIDAAGVYGPKPALTSFTTEPLPTTGIVDMSNNGITNPVEGEDLGTDYYPYYQWKPVDGALRYRLYVAGPNGVVIDTKYWASSICNSTVCSVLSPGLAGGSHVWRVQAIDAAGVYGPKPAYVNFSTTKPTVAPDPVDMLDDVTSPKEGDALDNYIPVYTWKPVTGAVRYRLYVSGPSGVVMDTKLWSINICNVDKCSVLSPTLREGNHIWRVQAINANGVYSAKPPYINFSTFRPTSVPGMIDLSDNGITNPAEGDVLGDNYNPVFSWKPVDGATRYRLYISGPLGVVLDTKFWATDICEVDKCSVLSPTLRGGNHIWRVQPINSLGYGPKPAYVNFSTDIPIGIPDMVDMTNNGITNPIEGQNLGIIYNPTYSWKRVDGAVRYRVYVTGPSGVVMDAKLWAVNICTGDVCSVLSPILGGGTHYWRVQTINAMGVYSSKPALTMFYADKPIIPPAANDLSVTLTPDKVPTYRWTEVDMATWYRVYVKNDGGVVWEYWIREAEACVGEDCSVKGPALANGAYTWWVQTYNIAGYGPWKSATFKISP
jgi:serine protease